MQMDVGLDTGPMLLTQSLPIPGDMNAQDLHDVLADIGGPLIVKTLAGLAEGSLKPEPQAEAGVTYAKKIDKAETRIDWACPAAKVAQKIRALYPMAWFDWQDHRIRVLAADVEDGQGEPGTALDDKLCFACESGAVRLTKLQPAGKNAMDPAAFRNGRPMPKGTRLS